MPTEKEILEALKLLQTVCVACAQQKKCRQCLLYRYCGLYAYFNVSPCFWKLPEEGGGEDGN